MIQKNIFNNIEEGKFIDQQLEPPHSRGILCGDINSQSIVTGSMDHGLRLYTTKTGKYKRELFSKRYGHSEWVTSVKFLKDQRILSAGMDGQICLWNKSSVKCDFLLGHETSISKIMVDDKNLAISSSYDCTLRLWGLDRIKRGKDNASDKFIGPHKSGIIDFDWHNSLLVSGDKNGTTAFWDINKVVSFKKFRNSHTAGVGKIFFLDNFDKKCVASAGLKDGKMNIYDLRTSKAIFKKKIHAGSINSINLTKSDFILTGSTDKNLALMDFRKLDSEIKRLETTGGVMDAEICNNLAIVGLNDGNLIVVDLDTMKTLYGFGAMQKGSVVVVKATEDFGKILVAGDDPTSLLLHFDQ